jgi:hypothetical protein
MTKDEMTTLLRSVGVSENTVTAMENAYELGFEQGANASTVMMKLVEEAESVCNSIDSAEPSTYPNTVRFWNLFDELRGMQ